MSDKLNYVEPKGYLTKGMKEILDKYEKKASKPAEKKTPAKQQVPKRNKRFSWRKLEV